MNLDTKDWKLFYLKDLYKIEMGNGFDKSKMSDDNPSVNFVSRVSYNNGVDIQIDRVSGIDPYPAELLSVALGGSYLGSCFVQEDFFYTAQNVAVMTPISERMSHEVNLFISGLVRFESKIKYYAFGRELNAYIDKNFSIKLPIKHNADRTPFIDETHEYSEEGYVPDWKFMEKYIKSLHSKPLTTKNKKRQTLDLKVQNWKEFTIPELFGEVKIAKSADIGNLEEGSIPFIGRTDVDNGVQGFVKPVSITKGNCITISMVGTNVALYQENDFQASQNIAVLRKISMTKGMALFICSMINFEMRLKYSYGRTVGKTNIEQMILKLPAKQVKKGQYVPDWEFMENYIKALPYGDRI